MTDHRSPVPAEFGGTPPEQPEQAPESASPAYTTPGASFKQLDYLASLAEGRELSEEAREQLLARVHDQRRANEERGDCAPEPEGVSKRRASEFIGRLLDLPKRIPPSPEPGATRFQFNDAPSPEKVPAGYYAVKNPDGELRFYRVKRGTRNPTRFWVHVLHGPEESELPYPAGLTILKKIAEDPAGAARTYGREIKSCSRCARRLTNRISRLLDIGPVCGGHFYDEAIWDEMREKARAALAAAGLDPDADVEDTDDLDAIRERAGL